MTDYFVAISEDGIRFRLKNDWTWEPDIAVSTANEGIRFRSSNWGDRIADVKAAEELDPMHETADWLMYETHVAGFPVNLSFRFVNRMLHTGSYTFRQEHSDDNDFLTDFESLKKLMSRKYGEENEINDYWFNDLYREDDTKRGLAVSAGHHAISVTWKDTNTEITLRLCGDNYEINLALVYTSKQLQALANEARELEKLAGL